MQSLQTDADCRLLHSAVVYIDSLVCAGYKSLSGVGQGAPGGLPCLHSGGGPLAAAAAALLAPLTQAAPGFKAGLPSIAIVYIEVLLLCQYIPTLVHLLH